MFAISAICSTTANISLRKYLFVGETTMNIIKFDRTQNKTQNLISVKCFESKIGKKMYLQIIVTLIKVIYKSTK